jgi:hypothetical protein
MSKVYEQIIFIKHPVLFQADKIFSSESGKLWNRFLLYSVSVSKEESECSKHLVQVTYISIVPDLPNILPSMLK